jgi:hypothetical protein
MSKTPRPDVHGATERLQVCAEYARVCLAFGGELLLALSGVTSTAYRVNVPSPPISDPPCKTTQLCSVGQNYALLRRLLGVVTLKIPRHGRMG